MRELHEKASTEIEKQDKIRQRRIAITEASRSNPNEIHQQQSITSMSEHKNNEASA